ncbi:hypothetical protein IV203_002061 [Nitzschia inconspicua]|uniref:DUF6824 domain-containing protein n=1 Tax=Nitzschia inconspicua TaxID=303405 RepID=A0A9K3PS73_9STRA|nr:hypothetical protein IV203_002061 [Nitzschia inconspicua]
MHLDIRTATMSDDLGTKKGSSSSSNKGSASSTDPNAVFLPAWFVPTEKDVICGWARQNHRHKGNQRFRQLVEFSAPLYVAAKTKLEKTNVIQSVVEKVRRDSVGGGFIKRDFQSGLWYEIGDDKARDKVGHAIRRVVEESSRARKVRKTSKEMKKGETDSTDEGNDDAKLGSGKKEALPSLDDFVESEVDLLDGSSNHRGATISGNDDAASESLSSNLMLPLKLDGVVAPSFLYQNIHGGPNAAMVPNNNLRGTSIPSLSQSTFSLDQQMFPRSDASLLQGSHQAQKGNDAALLNILSQATSRSGLEGWMTSSLQAMQPHNPQSITQQQHQHTQDQPLPRISGNSAQFDFSGDFQQARLVALLEEQQQQQQQQQRMNNQIVLQNRLSLTGETRLAPVSAPNNATLGSLGLFPPSTATMPSGGYGMPLAAPNFSPLLAGNTMLSDSSLTSTPGFSSLNDLSFVQSQQQQLQLLQDRNGVSGNNTDRLDGNNNSINNNNMLNFPFPNSFHPR